MSLHSRFKELGIAEVLRGARTYANIPPVTPMIAPSPVCVRALPVQIVSILDA